MTASTSTTTTTTKLPVTDRVPFGTKDAPNGLAITGALNLPLDETGARGLGGLLGTHIRAGTVRGRLVDAGLPASLAGWLLTF